MPHLIKSTKYPRTISAELLEAWKQLRRRGDTELICSKLGYSRPIIDRALVHGHVKTKGLTDLINAYYKARIDKENQGSDAIINAVKSLNS